MCLSYVFNLDINFYILVILLDSLASSLLAQQQRTSPTQKNAGVGVTTNGGADKGGSKLQPVTPEIQSSIKEVTSAIVHYVNDQTQQQQRSRSASPNSR